MNYLKYIEHSAENLQFYLWFQDYSARFEQLPESEKILAQEWTRAKAEAEAVGNTSTAKVSKQANEQVKEALKGTDFADGKPKPAVDSADPFDTPDKTPSLEEKRDVLSEYGSSSGDGKTTTSSAAHRSMADHAFDEAGMKWQPCMQMINSSLRMAILTSSQSPCSHTVTRSIASSAFTSRRTVLVSSIFPVGNGLPCCMPFRTQLIHPLSCQ
jgi:hypothetical protein